MFLIASTELEEHSSYEKNKFLYNARKEFFIKMCLHAPSDLKIYSQYHAQI